MYACRWKPRSTVDMTTSAATKRDRCCCATEHRTATTHLRRVLMWLRNDPAVLASAKENSTVSCLSFVGCNCVAFFVGCGLLTSHCVALPSPLNSTEGKSLGFYTPCFHLMQQNSDLHEGPNFVALDESKAYRNQVIYLRWNSRAMAAQRSAT